MLFIRPLAGWHQNQAHPYVVSFNMCQCHPATCIGSSLTFELIPLKFHLSQTAVACIKNCITFTFVDNNLKPLSNLHSRGIGRWYGVNIEKIISQTRVEEDGRLTSSPWLLWKRKKVSWNTCFAVTISEACSQWKNWVSLFAFRGKKALSKKKLKRRQKVKSKVKSRTKVSNDPAVPQCSKLCVLTSASPDTLYHYT